MTNADQMRDRQRQLWDALSPAWEQHDNWYQRQTHTIAEWLCRVADLRGGQRVLDLACGTGQPALTAARLVKPGGTVVATDLSEEMLRVARRKANMADMDNIEFKVMDAETIDFPDETFDGVTCRWGLMFCPDPERAVREVHRVLKPHRPFATTTFAGLDQNPFFAVQARLAVEVLGMAQPGPDGPTAVRLADTGRLKGILAAAGFDNIEIESRPFALEFNSLDDLWKVVTEWSPFFVGLPAKGEAVAESLRNRLMEETSAFRQGSRYHFPALAIGAYGQK